MFGAVYTWEVYLDGALAYSVRNDDARVFEGANVYVGSFWPAPNGEYDNFSFTLDTSSQSPTIHTVNPNLDQLFVDQYKVWSCFRDTVTGFYCDGQSTTAESLCGLGSSII